MKGGAKALIAEIRRNHYTKKGEVQSEAANEPSQEQQAVRRRRGRPPAVKGPVPDASGILGPNMFTVTIIGGMAIKDYPLKEGEKLAIAKLSPITTGT